MMSSALKFLQEILNVLKQLLWNGEGNTGRVIPMNNFKSVVEQIRNLEAERKNLLLEIEELKKMADSKAKALESEVSMLREEVKSLRVLLGADEVELDFGQKKKLPHR